MATLARSLDVVGVVEVVEVWIVLLPVAVAEDLDSLAMIYGDHGEGGDALLDALDDWVLTATKEVSGARAHPGRDRFARLLVHHVGLVHVRAGEVDEVGALLGRHEVVIDLRAGGPAELLDPGGLPAERRDAREVVVRFAGVHEERRLRLGIVGAERRAVAAHHRRRRRAQNGACREGHQRERRAARSSHHYRSSVVQTRAASSSVVVTRLRRRISLAPGSNCRGASEASLPKFTD